MIRDLTAAVDAAMIEMQNISPPLRRSDCERLIRAALHAHPVWMPDPYGWVAAGEPDPHGGRYDCERAELAMGDLTDDELANGAFMNYDAPLNLAGILAGTHSSPIAWMTAVKDRIRWLSRSLEQARAALSAPSHGEQVRDCEDWSVFVGYLIDKREGYTVAEENLQAWLADMIADPHYGALFRREKTADGKPVDHSLPVAMAIEAAEEEHGSLRAAAKALGIDPGYLSRLKSGEKLNPGDEVLSALGLERVTMYRAASPSAGSQEQGE